MRKNIALLSMDNDADDIQVNGVAEVLDQVSPDAEIGEVTALATEMEEIDEAVADGVETAEVLEDTADAVEGSIEEGGIPEVAAEAISNLLAHIQKGLGMPAHKAGLAVEGFKSKQTRVRSTQLAVESMRETAQKAWDAIKKVFNRVIEWITQFYEKMFAATVRLKNAAEKVKEEARVKKEENSGKISIPRNMIPKSGSAPSGKDIVKRLVALKKEGGQSVQIPASTLLTQQLEKNASVEDTKAAWTKLAGELAQDATEASGGLAEVKVDENGNINYTPTTAEKDGEGTAMSKAEVGEMCDAIIKIAEGAKSMRESQKKIVDEQKKMVASIEKVLNKDDSRIQVARLAATNSSAMNNFAGKSITFAITYARSALKVCTQSLGAKAEAAK